MPEQTGEHEHVGNRADGRPKVVLRMGLGEQRVPVPIRLTVMLHLVDRTKISKKSSVRKLFSMTDWQVGTRPAMGWVTGAWAKCYEPIG